MVLLCNLKSKLRYGCHSNTDFIFVHFELFRLRNREKSERPNLRRTAIQNVVAMAKSRLTKKCLLHSGLVLKCGEWGGGGLSNDSKWGGLKTLFLSNSL